jgi:hypothetical protein
MLILTRQKPSQIAATDLASAVLATTLPGKTSWPLPSGVREAGGGVAAEVGVEEGGLPPVDPSPPAGSVWRPDGSAFEHPATEVRATIARTTLITRRNISMDSSVRSATTVAASETGGTSFGTGRRPAAAFLEVEVSR